MIGAADRAGLVGWERLESRELLAAGSFPAGFQSIGAADWGVEAARAAISVNVSSTPEEYRVALGAGQVLSVSSQALDGGNPVIVLSDPTGAMARVAGGTGRSALLQSYTVPTGGNWSVSILSTTGSGLYDVTLVLGAASEGVDSSAAAAVQLNAARSLAGGQHWSVRGTSVPNESDVDVDVYTIDLTNRLGQRVDIVLEGIDGSSYTAQVLEVVGPQGNVVHRTAAPWSGNGQVTRYDLGILDFLVALPGRYTLRVTSTISGAYLLSVADRLPQRELSAREKIQWVIDQGYAAVGSVNGMFSRVSFETVFTSLSSDELLSILVRQSLVKGYADAASLRAALPGLGVSLEGLRPDGVLTALELANFGSLLSDSAGQRLTGPAAKSALKAAYAANPSHLLDALSTLSLFELWDDRITTSASDPRDSLHAYTRRALVEPIDNVLAAFRVQMQNEDRSFGPLPSGTAAAPILNQMPVGDRVVYVRDLHYVDGFLEYHIDRYDAQGRPYDYYMLWMDEWVKVVRQRYTTFFGQLAAAGGNVDLVMIDFEKKSLARFEMGLDRRVNPNSNPSRSYWEAVVADPRWGEIHQRLLEVGFSPQQLTVAALAAGWDSRDDREARWNAVMEERYSEYFHAAVIEPILRFFPQARIANFGEGTRSHSHPYGSYTRLRSSYYTVGALAGTHQSPVLYASPGTISTPQGEISPTTAPRTQIDRISFTPIVVDKVATNQGTVDVRLRNPIEGLKVGDLFRIESLRGDWIDPRYYGQFAVESISADRTRIRYTLTIDNPASPPAAYNLTTRVNTTATAWFQVYTSYNGLVGDVMELRSHVASSTLPLLPWISSPQFRELRTSLPYAHYGEGVFHAALAGADDFQLWKWSHLGTDPETDRYVSALLKELDGLIGYQNRFTLSFNEISWQDGYVLTGMEAGGRRVWRLTPNPELPLVDLSTSTTARFQIGDKLVEIPRARVYTPPVANSPLGIWIVQVNTDRFIRGTAADLAQAFEQATGGETAPAEVAIAGPSVAVPYEPLRFTFSVNSSAFDSSAPLTYWIDWDNDGRFDETLTGSTSLAVSREFTAVGGRQIGVRVTQAQSGRVAEGSHFVEIRKFRVAADPARPGVSNLLYGGSPQNDLITIRQIDSTTLAVYDSGAGSSAPQIASGVNGTAIVYGGAGDDVLGADTAFPAPALVLYGGAGNDLLRGGARSDSLDGGAGNDTIEGGAGNDLISGGPGHDLLAGGEGNDYITGGEGNDTLAGGPGDDFLAGEAGDDELDGGSGNDILLGGDGSDLLFGAAGRDILDGGRAIDLVYGGDDDDLIILGAHLAADAGNYARLVPLRDEWTANRSYTERIARITSGGNVTGKPLLEPLATVASDGVLDAAYGEGGQDWFWAAIPGDIVLDLQSGEKVTRANK